MTQRHYWVETQGTLAIISFSAAPLRNTNRELANPHRLSHCPAFIRWAKLAKPGLCRWSLRDRWRTSAATPAGGSPRLRKPDFHYIQTPRRGSYRSTRVMRYVYEKSTKAWCRKPLQMHHRHGRDGEAHYWNASVLLCAELNNSTTTRIISSLRAHRSAGSVQRTGNYEASQAARTHTAGCHM